MNIEKYISTGIVERYMAGLANRHEADEFEQMLQEYTELKQALQSFNTEVNLHVQANAGLPPSDGWALIEKHIEEKKFRRRSSGNGFILVDSQSNVNIRVHKFWRYIFIIVFILSKIFLFLAIYYYIKYNNASREIERLEQSREQQLSR